MDDATARATAILRTNRFIALGTADTDGPWTAPAQYRLLSGGALYVESHADSRHVRAIAASGVASGAIYDSRVESADADGVQFSAAATVVPREAAAIEAVRARRLHPEPDGDLLARPGMHLIVLELRDLWVFDREAWRTSGHDDRIAVDPAAVFALLSQ